MIMSKRSIVSKASCHDQQFRKRRDFHHKTELFNTFKPDEASSRIINKNKVRESIFNAKKLQRKSKLVERQSVDSSHNKSGRTSVFFSKRAMINFADKALQ
jgi:transcriptional regulator NrdR family protein